MLRRIAGSAMGLVPIAVLFVAGYERRWLHDDGFINLRVVRNLLDGFGPVYNIVERVEAFTSPLWIVLLGCAGLIGCRLEDVAVYGGLFFAVSGLALAELCAYSRLSSDQVHARRWRVPLGAAVFAALPPAWDFATSGLETGLAIFWLAASFFAVVAFARRDVSPMRTDGAPFWHRARPPLTAALLGLGYLIRPELALYAAALFVALLHAWHRRNGAAPLRDRARSAVVTVLAAIALPAAYQLFRMGYYGTLTANTALAKEAFRTNLSQGWCYFRNFFELYALVAPSSVIAIFAAVAAYEPFARARSRRDDHDAPRGVSSGAVANVLLVGAATLHVLYIVVIGGDYMHGRMFVPPVFAAILPFAVVELRAPSGVKTETLTRGLIATLLFGWAAVCATTLRVASENQCNIGDERGWYTRQAKNEHPVRVDDFRATPFYAVGDRFAKSLKTWCPSAFAMGSGSACRRIIELDSGDGDALALDRKFKFVDRAPHPALGGVAATGAIGLVGYFLPSTIHLVDRHGLADVVGARLAVEARGRPGHEKRLTDAWILARFTDPIFPEDAALSAARHALECGRLGALVNRVRAPLTWSSFFKNIAQASRMHRLRIPADPFAAEERFCGEPEPLSLLAGGTGGSTFSWRCPAGTVLVGLRGAIRDNAHAISQIAGVCRNVESLSDESAELIEGRRFGESSESAFDLACPTGSAAIGVYGRADHLVRHLGLVCTPPRDSAEGLKGRASAVGQEVGTPFDLTCPDDAPAIGIVGRSGSLVDGAGVLCRPIPANR